MQAVHKPNLFIIGSMKSGTTFLYKFLSSHPYIFMSRYKEPSYFVDPSQLKTLSYDIWKQGFWKSEENYLRLFQSPGSATILGEASVYYSCLPTLADVPEKMKNFNPEARLIYVMRDPIERIISHYWERLRWNDERRPLSDAIKNDSSYQDISYYAMQLSAYFQHFRRDQMCVLTFEELISNTSEQLASIFRWLNIDEVQIPIPDHQNTGPEIIAQPRFSGVLHRLRRENFLCRLAVDHTPDSIRKVCARLLRRDLSRLDLDVLEAVEHLRPLQKRQTQELTQLIGREFPEWTTLSAPR